MNLNDTLSDTYKVEIQVNLREWINLPNRIIIKKRL